MAQRPAVEIRPHGQQQADVGDTAGRRIGEARQQHVDEPGPHTVVGDGGEHLLELIRDQQDAPAFVAAAAIGEHVAQRQLTGMQARCQKPGILQTLDVGIARDIERRQSAGEREERVALELGADAEMAEAPVPRAVQPRRQAGQNDRGFAAAGRAHQRGQAAFADGLSQSHDRRVATVKKIFIARPEIGEAGIRA